MRVILADDSALIRGGLASLLATTDIAVCGQARDGAELEALVARDRPDVVITDIRMPPTFTDEGIAVAARLRRTHRGLPLLVLSTYAEADYAIRLLQLDDAPIGIGYLLKDSVEDIGTLGSALRRLHAAGSIIEPSVVELLMRRRQVVDAASSLSSRERDVLRLMAEGYSNHGIAQALWLGTKTVETHAASVFRKLGITSSALENRRVLATLTYLRGQGLVEHG